MPHRETTKPFIFFFLVLPHGVSSGFVSITLPFVLTRRLFGRYRCVDCRNRCIGQSLAIFVGPIADLTLTARRWYLIGLSAAALTLFLLGLFPLNPDTVGMLMAIVFISQVASTFIVLPVGGFTLPFQQWSCLRLDAVPRQRNTRRFRRSATCLSFT